VTQPRLNDLLRGRVGKFSIDALVELAARAGLTVHLEITMAA
jgi:predicted XRE-type DNA-binding protein